MSYRHIKNPYRLDVERIKKLRAADGCGLLEARRTIAAFQREDAFDGLLAVLEHGKPKDLKTVLMDLLLMLRNER